MEKYLSPLPVMDEHINAEVINDFFGDDVLHYEAVLTDFLAEVPAFEQSLAHLWQHEDFPALRQAVHRFKPLYHYVGLVQAYAQLQELEQQLEGSDEEKRLCAYQHARAHIKNALCLIEMEQKKLQMMHASKCA